MPSFDIRPLTEQDRTWVSSFCKEHWGSDLMVNHGMQLYISQQDGFLAETNHEPVGLVTYRMEGQECEITSLDSLREGQGIGSALIEAVKAAAGEAGCTRLVLITTNDNINALRFYQRRGFVFSKLYRNAVEESRKIKPEIPLIGNFGIPIRDEIEFEFFLVEK